jgi:oligoendopeptidase F
LNGLGEIFSYFGPFYSAKSAIGLVVATGNVGEYLTSSADEVNTYLTRDGGISWIEVAKGNYITVTRYLY